MKRTCLLSAMSIGVAALATPTCFEFAPRLLWNATSSVPIGLYRLKDARQLHVGDLVALRLPEAVTRLMVKRGYITSGIPVLKHIAALSGQTVCRKIRTISIEGIPVASALVHDSKGRSLPVWQGCRIISTDELFVLNSTVKDSFDGRYFGPVPSSGVIGKAVPVFVTGPVSTTTSITGHATSLTPNAATGG